MAMTSVSPLVGKPADEAAQMMHDMVVDQILRLQDVDAIAAFSAEDYKHFTIVLRPLFSDTYLTMREAHLAIATDNRREALELLASHPSFGALAFLLPAIARQEPVMLAQALFLPSDTIYGWRDLLSMFTYSISVVYPRIEEVRDHFGPDWDNTDYQFAGSKIAMFVTDLSNMLDNWELAFQLRSRTPPLGMYAFYFSMVCRVIDAKNLHYTSKGRPLVQKLIKGYLSGKPTSTLTPSVVAAVASKNEGRMGKFLSDTVEDCAQLIRTYIKHYDVSIQAIGEDLLLSEDDLSGSFPFPTEVIRPQIIRLSVVEVADKPVEANSIGGKAILVRTSIKTLSEYLDKYEDDEVFEKIRRIGGESQCTAVIRMYGAEVFDAYPDFVAKAAAYQFGDTGNWVLDPVINKEEILTPEVAWLAEVVKAAGENSSFDLKRKLEAGAYDFGQGSTYRVGVMAALRKNTELVMGAMTNDTFSGEELLPPRLVRDCITQMYNDNEKYVEIYNSTLEELLEELLVAGAKNKDVLSKAFPIEKAKATLEKLEGVQERASTFESDHEDSDEGEELATGRDSDYSP